MTHTTPRWKKACILAAAMGLALTAAQAVAAKAPIEAAVRLVERANAQIEEMVVQAQYLENATDGIRGRDTDAAIANSLRQATNRVASATVAAVAALGYKAVCTSYPVAIGNICVYIDPLEVIGW
jgi:hypothetical protein